MTTARTSRGALTVLTVLLVLLVVLPAKLVVAALGSAGTPAQIFGLLLFAYWIAQRIAGRSSAPDTRLGPVHFAIGGFVVSVLLSYVAAALRPNSVVEISAADRGLLSTLAWTGMAFVTADELRDTEQVQTLMRRLSIAAGALALVGILQYFTKQPLITFIQVPGLSGSSELGDLLSRNGLTRPAGTTTHPIEFGAVLTGALPFAMHFAMHDTHRTVLRRWLPVALIGLAIPISISRSAILSGAIVLAVVLPTWPKLARRRAYAAILLAGVGMYLTTSGLLKTIINLFTGISEDTSASSRTSSYNLAFRFIGQSPIVGRGYRTFLPQYRILDNQYLITAIEMGMIGIVAVLGLFVIGVRTAARTRRRTTVSSERSLANAFAASLAATGLSFAVYDALSFPMATSLLFVILGATGALYRTISATHTTDTDALEPSVNVLPE